MARDVTHIKRRWGFTLDWNSDCVYLHFLAPQITGEELCFFSRGQLKKLALKRIRELIDRLELKYQEIEIDYLKEGAYD